MHRQPLTPRPDWQKRVEGYGFHFHTLDDEPYWDESACYVVSNPAWMAVSRRYSTVM